MEKFHTMYQLSEKNESEISECGIKTTKEIKH